MTAEVLSLGEKTLELQKLSRHSGACTTQELCQKAVLREDATLLSLIFSFQKQELTKTIAARLGGDFEMGQSFNEFIYRASVLESGHC